MELKQLLLSTQTGRLTLDYLEKHNVKTYLATRIVELHLKADELEEHKLYGIWYPRYNSLYVSKEQSLMDAAGSLIHEAAHARGLNERDARIAEIKFYMQFSARSGRNLVFKDYLDAHIVQPVPQPNGTQGYLFSPPELTKYLKELTDEDMDANLGSRLQGTGPLF
jgi:hypothetical protein